MIDIFNYKNFFFLFIDIIQSENDISRSHISSNSSFLIFERILIAPKYLMG